MMTIPISKKFEICPQGEREFCITKVECDEKLGKFTFQFMDADGHSIMSYHNVFDDNGEIIDKRMYVVTCLARASLGYEDGEGEGDIDPMSLLGRFVVSEVYHDTYTDREGKERTSAKVRGYKPCGGFSKEPCKRTKDAMDSIGFVNVAQAKEESKAEAPAEEFDLF